MTENHSDRLKIIAGIDELKPGDILAEDIEYIPSLRNRGVAFACGRHITQSDVDSLENHSPEIRTRQVRAYRRLEEVERGQITRENFVEYTTKLCLYLGESGAFSDAYEHVENFFGLSDADILGFSQEADIAIAQDKPPAGNIEKKLSESSLYQAFAKATGDLSAYSSLVKRILDASKTDHLPLLYSLERFLGDDPKLRDMSVATAIASAAIGNFCGYDEDAQRSLFVSGACSYVGEGALKKLPKDQQQALKDKTHAVTRLMLSLNGEPINGLNAGEVDGASLWHYRHDGRISQTNHNLFLVGKPTDTYVFAGSEYVTGDDNRPKHNVRVRSVGKLAPVVRLARLLNRNSSENYVDSLARDIESVSAEVLGGLVRHSVYTPSGTLARLSFENCKNPNDNINGYYAIIDRNSQTYLVVFNNSTGGGLIIPEGTPHLISSTLQGTYPHRTIDGDVRGLGDGYIKQMTEYDLRQRGLTGWENAGFDPWRRGRCLEILHKLKERR